MFKFSIPCWKEYKRVSYFPGKVKLYFQVTSLFTLELNHVFDIIRDVFFCLQVVTL